MATMDASDERSPLLTPSRNKLETTPDAVEANLGRDPARLITIQGMARALGEELESRGYKGIAASEVEGAGLDEGDAPIRSVLSIPRHQRALMLHFPGVLLGNDSGIDSSSNITARPVPRPTLSASRASSSRLSPLSSQLVLDDNPVVSPSALLLAGILWMLLSIQADEETSEATGDYSVERELRRMKARSSLRHRLFAMAETLFDSFVGAEGEGMGSGQDSLVSLLFQDYPLQMALSERTTCSLDLLIQLASTQSPETERLLAHPVVLATTEHVWHAGLPPNSDTVRSISSLCALLDRTAIPKLLHAQTYILSTLQAIVTVYILVFSSYGHFYSFNPLAPDATGIDIPEHGHQKSWSVVTSLVWWWWIASTVGWSVEVLRTLSHRGSHQARISPATLLPILQHSLAFVSLAIRTSLLFLNTADSIILSLSLSTLAWTLPFLALARILPTHLPAFGTPTHLAFTTSKKQSYRPPPRQIAESHRSAQSLESRFGGLVYFRSYLLVVGVLLAWSLGGNLDYPETFHTTMEREVAPIEARTSLAFTLILGLLVAFFSGGRPLLSPSLPSSLDRFSTFGSTIAFLARRERLIVIQYFIYVPQSTHGVDTPFSSAPLSPPLNLFRVGLSITRRVCELVGRGERGRALEQRGRRAVWRVSMVGMAVWTSIRGSSGML